MSRRVGIVCIIDDDTVYRFTTQKYIELLGLAEKVISFGDGEEALGFIESSIDDEDNLPDIILVDVNMPIMDGWDFLGEYNRLRSRINKKVKLYMVSSSVDERDEKRSAEYEVDDYIVKPLDEDFLKELIS